MKLAKIKKGPTIKYFCDGCENLQFQGYYCTCKETTNLFMVNVNGNYSTPKECPYLLKTERRLKLNKINEQVNLYKNNNIK